MALAKRSAPVVIRLPELHPGQAEVKRSPARFKVLTCGRRWGKTHYALYEAMESALRGGRVWWIGPNTTQTRVAWRLLTKMVRKIPGCTIMKSEGRVEFHGEGYIEIRTAESESALVGDGLDLVIIDEAALIKEEVWTRAIRPTLSDRKGRAILISTPRGRNWFWRLFARGQDDQDPAWSSFQMSSYTNPYLDDEEVEDAKKDLPEALFRQEFLAEFLDEAGSVFRSVADCSSPNCLQSGPRSGGIYYMGLDIARKRDWTVITVMDASTNPKRVVAYKRIQKVKWDAQIELILSMAAQWGVRGVIADGTGVGDPLVERLRDRMTVPVASVVFTNRSKEEFIQNLALGFESAALLIPDDPVYVNELKGYEAELLPSGRLRYGAPSGMNDDIVISLALVWAVACGINRSTDELAEVTDGPVLVYHNPIKISSH